MTDLNWPPRDRDEMLAWQKAHGSDIAIGAHVGRSHTTVQYFRVKMEVPSFTERREGTQPSSVKPPRMSEQKMADLYDDRTYDDVEGAR